MKLKPVFRLNIHRVKKKAVKTSIILFSDRAALEKLR